MTKGTRVRTKDGQTGEVSYSYGTANEVRLDNGNYRYVMDSNLTPISSISRYENNKRQGESKDYLESRAGESVAELETLPQCKHGDGNRTVDIFHHSGACGSTEMISEGAPVGMPDSIESHKVESVPEKDLPIGLNPGSRQYFSYADPQAEDGPEVDIMRARHHRYIGLGEVVRILGAISHMRKVGRG